eukprot:189_1
MALHLVLYISIIFFALVFVFSVHASNCGFVFDSDEQSAVPLHTCSTNYEHHLSYEYYCQDSKIYKCIYSGTHCNGSCTQQQYTGYDLPNCDMRPTCPMVEYTLYHNCQHKRERKSLVVDTCIPSEKHNKSIIWKCKGHSMAKYVYNGRSCDTNRFIDTESIALNNHECQKVDNEYISIQIVSCSSPKCRATQDINSYQICNIFADTNVDEVMPFWDTYADDYCEWFGEDPSFQFNIYQCDHDGDELGLTLSLAANTIHGTLNTTHYAWPHDLHRLNLNDLGLNGEWNWWSLQHTNKLQYIDISNNNFTGKLELHPLLYSNTLHTLKISNNPLMSGYIDWQWIGYMADTHDLNAFLATKIPWNGYADFTQIPSDKQMFIEVDKAYRCDPYKYLCTNHAMSDRSRTECNDQLSCEATCQCADGSLAIPTHFPYTPVLGTISCGDTIDNAYEVPSPSKGMWGDNGHYYWINIPKEYGKSVINITLDATHWTNFDAMMSVYTLQDEDSDTYQRVYDTDNPLRLTVALNADGFHYVHIIANQSDYSSYEYTISMDGCTVPPTPKPTPNPTVFYSTTTEAADHHSDVVFDVVDAYEEGMMIYDVYGRIEISIKLWIQKDLDSNTDCLECFEWWLREEEDKDYVSLNEDYGYGDNEITFYNTKSGLVMMDGVVYDVIHSYLIISSIRTLHAGYCADPSQITDRILHAGGRYSLKLKVSGVESEPIVLRTHSPPFGGQCVLYPDESSGYMVNCSDWSSYASGNKELNYNILYEDVPLYTAPFVSNSSVLLAMIDGSGDAVITALIEDDVSVTSCYDMVIAFPIINSSEYDIDGLTAKISQNSLDVVSIFSAIHGVLSCSDCFTPSTYKTYYDLIDTLFDVLLTSSVVLGADTNYSVSLQDIVHELSIFIAATQGYIGPDALQILVHSYTPKLLKSIKLHLDSVDMYAMSIQLHHLIHNLELYVSELSDMRMQQYDFVDALTQNTLHASHLALLRSYPGEIFTYSLAYKHMMAQKLKSNGQDDIQCGFETEYIEIPKEISTAHMVFDCSLLKIDSNASSSIISVNLYEDDNHIPINLYRDTDHCDPYLIWFHLNVTQLEHNNYSLYEETVFPGCKAWNNSNDEWHDEECFVYDMNEADGIVTCGCTRLGTHRVISESLHLTPHVIASWNWRDISTHTLHDHWIGWMSVAVLFVITIGLGGLKWMDSTVNRPILAYEDVIFLTKRNERMKNDISGKEIAYIERYLGCDGGEETFGEGMCGRFAIKSLCMLHAKLFVVYLLDGHIFLSIFVRPSGSNISVRSRIGLFFMYLCTIMAVTAMFYGVHIDAYDDMNIVMVSVIISLTSALPVYCVQQLFVKSKPKSVRKKVFLYEDIELQRVHSRKNTLDDDSILAYLRESHRDRAAQCIRQTEDEHANLNEVYSWSLSRIKRNSINEKIGTLDVAVDELRKTNSNVHRLQLVDDIRITLFNTLYPLPHRCKCVAWLLLICWTCFVALITVLFSLQFDLKYEAIPNPNVNDAATNECWQNDKKLWIESQLSYQSIDALNANLSPSMAVRWSTGCCLSVLLLTLIFEPIFIYCTTWLKIWMFSHHLSMKMSVSNLCSLFAKACSDGPSHNYKIARHNTDATDFESHVSYTYRKKSIADRAHMLSTRPRRHSSSCGSYNIVHPDRPLDVFGYLCNDDLFLSIDAKSGRLRAISNHTIEAPSLDSGGHNYDDEDYYKEYHYQEEDDDDAADLTVVRHANHTRQTSYTTDLSVTMTENGEFDSRELAMMRVAAGNIFDYKADVIHEGDEEEELSHVFSFDINSDGIEESDDDDVDVAISMDDDFDSYPTAEKSNRSSETSDEDELVETIVRALSDEKNRDCTHQRNTTESMLNQLTATLYPQDDNDAVTSAIYDPQDDQHELIDRRYDKKQFFAE